MISSIIALGCSYIGYLLLLKNDLNLRFNRFYLLGSLLLGLAAPALSIDSGLPFSKPEELSLENKLVPLENEERVEENSIVVYRAAGIDLSQIVFWFYLLICSLLLFRFCKNFLSVFLMTKRWDGRTCEGLRIVDSPLKGNPYSFFHYLFVHSHDLKDPEFKKIMLLHEKAHSQEFHAIDVILAELSCCLFWFNPFTWLYKKCIVENHEYLADSAVVKSGVDIATYSRQIIFNGERAVLPVISGFSFIKTKNRINMLYREKTFARLKLFKLGMALLLVALVFAVSSFSLPTTDTAPFVVVVDAGHGGKDIGPFNEKEVNFQISQQLKSLSSKGNIEIILVRKGDEFISLKDRVEFASSQDADLFLSLHSNTSTDPSISGVEAYYATESNFSAKSLQFSKILISKQVEKVANRGEVKSANFVVLRDVPMPAVLLELGYLSNRTEASRLRDPDHQKLVAKAIFEGLQEIRAQY